MILAIRTDQSNAYVGIWQNNKELTSEKWEAGRELSNTLLQVIKANCDKVAISIQDIRGVVVFKGPGSYTGLRIGISVANTLSYSLSIPVVASSGDNWIIDGLKKLETSDTVKFVVPNYGGQPHITKQRK